MEVYYRASISGVPVIDEIKVIRETRLYVITIGAFGEGRIRTRPKNNWWFVSKYRNNCINWLSTQIQKHIDQCVKDIIADRDTDRTVKHLRYFHKVWNELKQTRD